MKPDTQEPWYARSFGQDYAWRYKHRDDASAQAEMDALLLTMGISSGSRALDVCCGAGRHMSAALSRGVDIYGVDLSESLLEQAASREGLADRVIKADIRKIPYEREFDAAWNLFTSFGYFSDDEENRAALSSIVKTVKPGGWVVLDHINKALTLSLLKTQSKQELSGRVLHHHREVYQNTQRVKKTTQVFEAGVQVDQLEEDVRLFEPLEMQQWFEDAGMQDVVQFGSYDGREYEAMSPRMITVGKVSEMI